MRAAIFLLMLCLGLLSITSSQRGRCPRRISSRPGICAFTCNPRGGDCGRGRRCCRTGCGGTTCVDIGGGGGGNVPWWCPRGSPRIRCFVNPCTVLRCPAIPWARCRPTNPCEPDCTGAFYIGRRRVPQWACEGAFRRG